MIQVKWLYVCEVQECNVSYAVNVYQVFSCGFREVVFFFFPGDWCEFERLYRSVLKWPKSPECTKQVLCVHTFIWSVNTFSWL